MYQLLHTPLKRNKGQAMIEYLIVTAVLVIFAGIAVNKLAIAMSSYFGFIISFISLPIP